MIVNPGIRRFLGSAIQRLFNSASVSLPLTHTAIPTRGDITPTFTRATPKTVTNNDGYLVTLLAGEIGFPGARRVRNQLGLASTNVAAWSVFGAGASLVGTVVGAGPNGETVSEITLSSAAAVIYVSTVTYTATGRHVNSIYVKAKTSNTSLRVGGYDGVAAFDSADQAAVTTGWTRISHPFTAGNSTTIGQFRLLGNTGGTTTTLYVCNIQSEDVTAQTTQTAGEYVSVGVPSDWAGDELVTNGTFDSDTTGWIDQLSSLAIASGALEITNTGTNYGRGYQEITTVVGGKYVASAFVRKGTCTTAYLQAGSTLYGTELGSVSTTSATAVLLQFEFVATSTTTYINCLNSNDNDATGYYDNISVKPAYYHGSFVDGVKCFPTDLSGNPIPSTTMLGYQAEGARTNLCLQSQNYAATWTTTDYTITSTNNIAPDGTATASLMTEGSAGTATISQPVTATANANYSYYRYIKRSNNDWWQLTVYSGGNVVRAWFNLATGVKGSTSILGTATVVSINMTPANDGWYRCEVNVNIGSGATSIIFQGNSATADASTFRVNGASAYMWGNQFNDSASFASSYIATTTAAVARNADVESVSTNGNIAAAAGSIYLEYTPTHTPSGTIALWGTYVDASNYTAILHDATNLIFRKRIAGSNYDATIANAFVSGTTYKVAATWGAAGTAIYLDGVAGTPHANTTAAQIAATMQVGADGNSLQQPGAGTTNLRIWQRQLSSPEGVAVTA